MTGFHRWDLSRINVVEGKVNFISKVNGTQNVYKRNEIII